MPPLRVHLLVFVQRFPYPSVFRVLIVWFVTALCKRGYWPLEHWDLGWRPTQVMNICPRLICRIVTGPATAKALPRSPRKNAEKWFEDVAENILDKGLGLERTNMPKHTHAPTRARARVSWPPPTLPSDVTAATVCALLRMIGISHLTATI